jgi:hypothetical protein
MTAEATLYDSKPWTAAYGNAIAPVLPPARYQNLAQMVHSACERFGKQTAFTAVVPNWAIYQMLLPSICARSAV